MLVANYCLLPNYPSTFLTISSLDSSLSILWFRHRILCTGFWTGCWSVKREKETEKHRHERVCTYVWEDECIADCACWLQGQEHKSPLLNPLRPGISVFCILLFLFILLLVTGRRCSSFSFCLLCLLLRVIFFFGGEVVGFRGGEYFWH